MDPVASLPPEVWGELIALVQEDSADRSLVERLLELWRLGHGASGVALYVAKEEEPAAAEAGGAGVDSGAGAGAPDPSAAEGEAGGGPMLALRSLFELEVACGELGLPQVWQAAVLPDGVGRLALPDRTLLFKPAAVLGALGGKAPGDPLTLLLASALRNHRLRLELKEQQFQVNYRIVELESLYDVGLAVAATLDLERVSEEILLRAVSLLDARRGALYLIEGDSYRLDRTLGGTAAARLDAARPDLAALLSGAMPQDLAVLPELLPGARYLLAVPIEIENRPRGLLVVGDKESRRGVGPFPPASRRTLALFANQAAIALENARLHLQALEKERLEREMHLASEIQSQILPRSAPEVPGFQLLGWNRPARQVGGDYFDLFLRAGGRVGMVVGDVSGKGMPAALMVSTLHSALHLLLDQAGFGPPLLERLNRHILESSASNKFITMLLAELDPASGSLLYLNAGHNPGLLLRAAGAGGDGEVVQLPASGLPLGLMPATRFQARELTIQPGDLLCLYSDGITECESPQEVEFGTGRLVDLLRAHRAEPLPATLAAIQKAMADYSAGLPQGDDQTVVLLRRD